MRHRRDPLVRCPDCRLRQSLCVCGLIPRLQTDTHLLVVLHQAEAHKSSNTGRLAARALARGAFVQRIPGDELAAPLPIPAGAVPYLLYPDASAMPLAEVAARHPADAAPVCLVVPDGTWGQASRMRRRLPMLAALPCVALPEPQEGDASSYRLRHAHLPERLSTLEAIARAVELLEATRGRDGARVRAELERLLRVMVERTLFARGKLRAEEVFGGLPPGAVRDHRGTG